MWRNDDEDRKEGALIGCFLLVVGGCARIGGLLFFIKLLIDLFPNVFI